MSQLHGQLCCQNQCAIFFLAAHLEDQCSPITSKYCFVEASAHGTPVSRRDLCITMSKPKYPVLYILKYDTIKRVVIMWKSFYTYNRISTISDTL